MLPEDNCVLALSVKLFLYMSRSFSVTIDVANLLSTDEIDQIRIVCAVYQGNE